LPQTVYSSIFTSSIPRNGNWPQSCRILTQSNGHCAV